MAIAVRAAGTRQSPHGVCALTGTGVVPLPSCFDEVRTRPPRARPPTGRGVVGSPERWRGRIALVSEEIQLEAGELTAGHVGMRIYIKRAEAGDLLVGRLISVHHRPAPRCAPVRPWTCTRK
jgi:hypothetical protein